ncbi:putative oxidoreductase [Mesorhizobium albiziae]|uniref:Putative oxidoreductase n=1 Tax=Neomesorhizobium albiziae TaxID=335020 RepID=A0A1I4B3J1_9HYPH|nr:DoxX family protein [Mesorhizobium albiziae]GLS34281.1 membrane protein [Mesorhizobium albiziae]SFK62950.1 putative oxidoreductase [Mesorhizobium albiziae]
MSINSSTAGANTASGGAVLILLGRILLSVMFILAGFGKLTAIGATAGWFGSIGLPAPTIVAVVVGLVELLGGIAILIGFQTRIAALVLAVFTLAATAIAHLDFADQIQVLMLQKNLGVTGGFLILAAVGAGALSVDAKRG